MAWTWVEKLQQRVREMTGVTKAADYEAILQTNAADQQAAQAKLRKARAELDRQYIELELTGDKVAVQRLRKQIRDAQEAVRELEYAGERLLAARDGAAAAEFAADVDARWLAAEELSARWKVEGEEIGATLSTLVEQVGAFLKTGRDLRQILDGDAGGASLLSDDIRSIPGVILWNPGRLAREIDLQLWAHSDGLLAPRSGGIGAGTPYQLRCGPAFQHRVKESIALAFKGRAQAATPEPPEAA